MKVLVLGASGMAGHVIALYLRENGLDVDTLSDKNLLDKDTHLIDATETDKLKALLDHNKYDVVVNCIALLVKQSEERKDLAVHLNSYLPHFLEEYYKNNKTRVIQISTDGVFSTKNPPYLEDSAYDGDSFYGRTKALGELINSKDLTFRLSITGPDMKAEGNGLFNWFSRQKGEVQGYTNVLWSGVTTIELAKAIKAAVDQKLIGIFHLVPEGSISKFDLLQLFKEVFDRKDITLKKAEGVAVGATLTNTRKDFDHQVPDYKTMVIEMKDWIRDHSNLYKHYEE